MTEEIWKPISGYEEKYQVSNLGRVKSLNYRHTGKEKILKLCNNGHDYLCVNLYSNGKRKLFRIHRLVAEVFLSNPDNLPIINHKDENKQNNCAENLEYCSVKYNNCYGTRLERASKSCSKKVGCYKDGKLIKIYNSIIDTEKDGFYHGNVINCCMGKYKSSGGFTWCYIEN